MMLSLKQSEHLLAATVMLSLQQSEYLLVLNIKEAAECDRRVVTRDGVFYIQSH